MIEHTGTRVGRSLHEPGLTSDTVEISMVDLVLLLAHRRRFLLLVTLACFLIALVLAYVLPVRYTATTTILPPQQSSSFSSSLLSQLGGLGLGGSGLPGLKSNTDLYVGLLKSTTVEDAMVQTYKLEQEYKTHTLSDARKVLVGRVTIDGSGKDGLIRISVEDRSAQRAADLANGYVAQYRKLSASLAIGEASQRRLFLEQQMQQTKNNLATAEEDLKRTEQTTGMFQLDSQARALIESAASLRAQITAKEVQVQSMRTYAGAGNVDLIQAEGELSGLRAQMSRLGGKGSGGELILPKGQLPQAGLDYVRKLREVKYNETIFEILARQFEAAKLDEAREGSIIQVVDKAAAPDRKSWPPRLLFAIGGILLGFLGAASWLIVGEVMRKLRAHSPSTPFQDQPLAR